MAVDVHSDNDHDDFGRNVNIYAGLYAVAETDTHACDCQENAFVTPVFSSPSI